MRSETLPRPDFHAATHRGRFCVMLTQKPSPCSPLGFQIGLPQSLLCGKEEQPPTKAMVATATEHQGELRRRPRVIRWYAPTNVKSKQPQGKLNASCGFSIVIAVCQKFHILHLSFICSLLAVDRLFRRSETLPPGEFLSFVYTNSRLTRGHGFATMQVIGGV